jgi:TolA-binding protein
MTRSLLVLLALAIGSSAPAQQAPTLEGRVGRIEKELRAVQRKVFPSANPEFFDPEITAAPAAPAAVQPGSTAVADLTARVDTLERELQRLTAQGEQNGYRLRQLEDQMAAMKARADAQAPVSPDATASAAVPPPSSPPAPVPVQPAASAPVAAAPSEAPAPAPSADPGEAAYLAAYKLWEDKRYAEAQTALKAVVAKYPKHRRASYAQNLLGRAYLDDGKPASAAEAFLTNYRTRPQGERAPDSLYFLGEALTDLKKPAEACKVFAELEDVYGPKLSATLKTRVAAGKAAAKCGG